MKKLLLLGAMSALLAACGAKNSGTSTTSAAETPQQAPAPVTAPTDAELNTATQETASTEQASAGDASLERVVAMPENVQLPGGRWKSGTHFRPIVPAQPTNAKPGEVEVIEVMWLGCAHCDHLQPYMEAWEKNKPPYVKFTQEAAMWGPVHRAHGKLLYTLQNLGRNDLVRKAFDEIHRRNNMLVASNDAQTLAMGVAFAKANGISEADFKREYSGFAVNTRLQRAEDLNRRYRVEGVPVVYINGKYQTDVSMAGGQEQLVQLIADLAAYEKGR
jgi:thiol:disulfide interchange protein DsbA